MVTIQKDQPEERRLTDQDLMALNGWGESFGKVAGKSMEGPCKSAMNKMAFGCNQSFRDKSSSSALVAVKGLTADEVQHANDILHDLTDDNFAENSIIYSELDAAISARAKELNVELKTKQEE
ncbi:MAG: hypothetical protein ABH851_04725 [Methanobacteriota archaeon]